MDVDDPELDPSLAALYDVENVWAADDDFFLSLVRAVPGSRVVDVGCGTGRLTTAIASAGHVVVGVDPNPAFLAMARVKPGGERVAWVRGTAADLPSAAFDVALMTSHVAQAIVTDEEWVETLAHLRRAVVDGGLLAFDTRDPAARAWERWDSGSGRIRLPGGAVLDRDVAMCVEGDVVTFTARAVLSDGRTQHDPGGSPLAPGTTSSTATWSYRFRDADCVRRSVEGAGFTIEAMYGGWHTEPLGAGTGEIVVVARAASRPSAGGRGDTRFGRSANELGTLGR